MHFKVLSDLFISNCNNIKCRDVNEWKWWYHKKKKKKRHETLGRTSHGMGDREWPRVIWVEIRMRERKLEDTCTSIRSEKRTILAPCLRTSQKLLGSNWGCSFLSTCISEVKILKALVNRIQWKTIPHAKTTWINATQRQRKANFVYHTLLINFSLCDQCCFILDLLSFCFQGFLSIH